jgi:hypothetical protein
MNTQLASTQHLCYYLGYGPRVDHPWERAEINHTAQSMHLCGGYSGHLGLAIRAEVPSLPRQSLVNASQDGLVPVTPCDLAEGFFHMFDCG